METPIERRLWIKSLAKRPKMSMMRESCSLRIHQPPVSDQGGISGDTRRLAAKFATLGTGYKQNAMYSNLGVWLPSCIAKEARVVSLWYPIILSNYIQFYPDMYSLDSHILCSVMVNNHYGSPRSPGRTEPLAQEWWDSLITVEVKWFLTLGVGKCVTRLWSDRQKTAQVPS